MFLVHDAQLYCEPCHAIGVCQNQGFRVWFRYCKCCDRSKRNEYLENRMFWLKQWQVKGQF
jgi:hypothetical protein